MSSTEPVLLELFGEERELLIATLEFAEGAAFTLSPTMTEAIKALGPLRSRLVETYLHATIHGEQVSA
jgi:hypothetical protein